MLTIVSTAVANLTTNLIASYFRIINPYFRYFIVRWIPVVTPEKEVSKELMTVMIS